MLNFSFYGDSLPFTPHVIKNECLVLALGSFFEKPDLKPFQIKLLEEGAQSQNQAFILNDMWCEWKSIAVKRKIQDISSDSLLIKDPWEEEKQEIEPYR